MKAAGFATGSARPVATRWGQRVIAFRITDPNHFAYRAPCDHSPEKAGPSAVARLLPVAQSLFAALGR